MGRMEIAHDLIETGAHFCKADGIKFQKLCPRELLTPEQYNAPHSNPANFYGKTYGEHREFLKVRVDGAAYMLDAHIIERHYTLDRMECVNWRGT